MSQQELLKKIIDTFDRLKIDYMLTGSVVSSLQGEPRATHDIDVVIAVEKTEARELIKAFPSPDFYMDQNSVFDAVNRRSMFNLIDSKGGGKVDFWILTSDQFDRSRFSRKYAEEFMGIKMSVSTPEDTILAKLRWTKLSGGSDRHFIDALRVYEVQFGLLDSSYLEYWAEKLMVKDLWTRLKAEAVTE
ncbi:MAG: hypothetical protein ACE5K8_02540 [Candidatus Zixiibacteriota bacterium]